MILELSLTVPITNSTAFLFTVIGEWWVEKKVISRGELSAYLKNLGADFGRYLDWYDIFVVRYCTLCAEQAQIDGFINRMCFVPATIFIMETRKVESLYRKFNVCRKSW